MKCGYNEGIKKGNKSNNIPECKDSIPTQFDGVPQFLMWFTEWSEDFCNHKKTHLKKLEQGCRGCTLRIDGTCEKDGSGCQKCSQACEEYKAWLQNWKDQYKKQSKKYSGDKKKELYKTVPKVKNSTHAYEYLQTQLEKLCEKGKCDYTCMKNPSTENSTENMPESLDVKPDIVKDKCPCPPQKIEKPDSTLNCIDRSAFELYAKAKSDLHGVKDKLKGNNTKNIYEETTNGKNDDNIICKINESISKQNNVCKKNENLFDDIDKWDCKKRTNTVPIENICIPPRRETMCAYPLKN
ncbi:hypothetical protein PFHG_05472 [Plasmodium falciparum HB3]|uniref:Duffy-binding-like domain-containing protein n=1 Tax=Plasmodium falciparum (isolate HB3) TaxID=137071 RepID=A0A0L7KLW6_PLAFX|nr:hypothetical protein PFHG_05472 [Plasmodium falciparum HB3]